MSNNDQEVEIYQYNLNIISVSMKIKFPCKMHIQLNNTPITTEITSVSTNKFIFNQEITLKEDPDKQFFELVVHLTTDKGAKYIGGVIKLLNTELMNSEGQRLNIPLIKCLDTDASCQLRVDQVTTSKVLAKSKLKSKLLSNGTYLELKSKRSKSPTNGPNQYESIGGAKSEFYFPLSNVNPRKGEWDRKTRELPQLSYVQKRRSPSRINQIKDTQTYDDQVSFQGGLALTSNILEAEVYKEGYQKLKQKYRKQAEVAKYEQSKRIELENNENNYRLQIMRLKSKTQEQQKSLTDKNSKITQLQNQLVSLQKKEMDLNYMKEQAVNKDHQIRVLEETVKNLQRDNNELKLLNNARFASDQLKINQLKDQIYQLKLKFEQKEAELARELKQKAELVFRKDQQISTKNEVLERQRFIVQDLERSSQNKIFEFEKILQNQRVLSSQKLNQQREKRSKIENERIKLEEKIKELNAEIERAQLHTNKIEYDIKILTQSGQSLKSELEEFKAYKQKYTELSREFKFLSDDKLQLQKQLQKTIYSKEINLTELSKQHNSQLQYYKNLNRQFDQKNRQLGSKIIELQSQIEITKNHLQKAKRNFAAADKDLNDSRNREKELKQTLASKDQHILSLQTEVVSIGQLAKNTQQALRLQLEKVREELEKTKTELQSEKIKNNQLNENNSLLSNEVSKLKMKCQFLEQKSEKEQSNLNDRITNLENDLKDSQNQVTHLTHNLTVLKQSQKQLLQRIKGYDLSNILTNQTIEKLRKQIKVFQQKLSNSEAQTKAKVEQIHHLNLNKENLERKIQQNNAEMIELNAEINRLLGDKNKNQKIIQMLQEDILKAKEQNNTKTKSILEKEAKEQELREQIKKNKQDITKMEMKYTSLKKQSQKFRESLVENITSSFAQLPLIEAVLHDTGISFRKSIVEEKTGTSPAFKSHDSSGTDIISMILNNTKDAKISLNKLIEQNKQLLRENERLSQDMTSTNKKAMNNQQALSQQIQQLQEELAILYSAKQQQTLKSEDEIFKLNSRMRQKQSSIKDLNMNIEELEFALNNIKIDLEVTHEEFTKRQTIMKKEILELKQQIQYQTAQIGNLQDYIEKMQEQIFLLTSELETEKENVNKRDFKITELIETKEKLEAEAEDLKRHKKHHLERISELEFKLTSETELKQKHLLLLEEEQSKNKQLKAFIDSLMKQKEGAIKSELGKSQTIINLQSDLIELERQKDIIQEENQKNKKIIEDLKEQIKKISKNLKEVELQLSEEKTIASKVSEKLREREKELSMKTQQLVKLEEKYKKHTEKTSKSILDLQAEMDQKYTNHLISEKENNEKILNLERQLNRLQTIVEKQRSEITQYEEFVFAGKQKNQELTEANKVYEEEITELKKKVQQLDFSNTDLSEELKQKEEALFQMSGKVYNLEMKLQAKEVERQQKIDSLTTEWSLKYNSIIDEYEQRVESIEKQKRFAYQRVDQKETEIRRLLSETKLIELDGQNTKRVFEEKIKKIEEERLVVLSQKNIEIQRITEENKQNYDKLKQKENFNRKISHEIEIAKDTISKLDIKLKESDEKIKNSTKIYQTQIEQLKKKEANYKSFKENFVNSVWKAERQVRKTVQYFVKNLLTVTDDKNSKAVIELTKTLENNVVNAMAIRIDDKEIEKTN